MTAPGNSTGKRTRDGPSQLGGQADAMIRKASMCGLMSRCSVGEGCGIRRQEAGPGGELETAVTAR